MKVLALIILLAATPLARADSGDGGAGDAQAKPAQVPFRARTRAECTEIDARDTMPPELKEFFSHPRIEGYFGHDPRQDDSIGMCFAIAAADLLSYQTGKPVSALYLFLNYSHSLGAFGRAWRAAMNPLLSIFEHDPSPIPDGGVVYGAIQESLDPHGFGICEESALPSSHRADFDDLDLPAAIGKLKKGLELAEAGSPEYQAATAESGMQKVFVGLGNTPAQVSNALNWLVYRAALAHQNTGTLLAQAAQQSCADHLIPPNASPSDVVTVGHDASDILTPIDQQLNQTARPNIVSILYDTAFTRTLKRRAPLDHYVGSHDSPIIGRQWNEEAGRCEYHLRDSLFGDSCDNYNPQNVRCTGDGTFWVSDEVLWNMTSWVTYIRQPSQGSSP